MNGLIALSKKLDSLPADKDKVKLCLFVIDNGLRHHSNVKARLAGYLCHGYLSALLVQHNLYSFRD